MPPKLLKFFIFILISFAVFLAGYLFSSRQNFATQNLGRQALINNSLVSRFNQAQEKYVEPTGLFPLTSGEASFPTLSTNGTEIWYYITRTGEIRSVTIKNPLAGSVLVAKIQPNASFISWGANKTLVANYSSGTIYYDLNLNFSKKYETRIKNPALSKTGTKIAYTYFDQESGNGNISIADPKLESFKNILLTRFADWQIHWLGENKLALIKPPTLENTRVSLFTLNTEGSGTLQNIINLKSNLETVWSSDGQKIIYSYVDSSTGQNSLYLIDSSIGKEIALNLNYAASRCAWGPDNKTVYCAGIDSFVSFVPTAATVETRAIASSQGTDTTSATNLLLTGTGDYLIFKNLKDGKLYGLGLNQ